MWKIFKRKEKENPLKLGDKVTLRGGEIGEIIRYPSGNLGINIKPYIILCEPLSNYEGLKHKYHLRLDILTIN